MRYAMNVGCSQPQFGCSRSQKNFVSAINLNELLCNILCSIGTSVINDYELIINFAKTSKFHLLSWRNVKLNLNLPLA